MGGIGKRAMSVRFVGTIVIIDMVISTRIDYLAGSQHRTAAILALAVALGGTWSARGQLLAHIVGQGQTATGASIAACIGTRADAIGPVRLSGSRVALEKVWMIFDLGGGGFVGGSFLVLLTFGLGGGWRRIVIVGGGGIIGKGGFKFIRMTLRTGEGKDLGADDGGRAVDLAEMRQGELQS